MRVCHITKSCPTLATSTVAHQASLSMGFLRKEHWNELPFPPPGDLIPEIESMSPAQTGGFFTTEPPRKPSYTYSISQCRLTTFS